MIACSTKKALLVFNEDDIENAFTSKPVMVEYKAYWNKLVGYGFIIKHNILNKVRHWKESSVNYENVSWF